VFQVSAGRPHFTRQLHGCATCARAGEHTAAPAGRLQGSITPLRRARAARARRAPGSRASSPGNLRVPSKRGAAPCGSSSRRRPPPPAGRGAHSRRAWRGSPLGAARQAMRPGRPTAATRPTIRHPALLLLRTALQDGRRPGPTLCPAQGLLAQGARLPRHAPRAPYAASPRTAAAPPGPRQPRRSTASRARRTPERPPQSTSACAAPPRSPRAHVLPLHGRSSRQERR